jgi:2-oxoacid:acceptor oxidoreductase delta subunit (pyruvate/2-ketoisovalerate family)
MKVAGTTSGGRARVVADATGIRQMHIDHLFTAIGAEPAESWQHPPTDPDAGIDLGFALLTDGPLPMVFGGDLATDTKSVTDAIASGKTAAMAIDTLLTHGVSKIPARLGSCRVGNGPALSFESYLGGARKKRLAHVVRFSEINTDYFSPFPEALVQAAAVGNRVRSFREIEATLSAEAAAAEARRCFNCGLCNHCDNCQLYCPELAVTAGATREVNYDYCKGCGICVTECPRNAMALEEEKG